MSSLYVAKPLLPALSDINALLGDVWDSGIVTNEGPLSNHLEAELAMRLGVPVAKLFCNGTTALQCALLSLNLPGGAEVITTPLTFAATAHAISACGLKPVFADVDPETLTLDPRAVERAITTRTGAVIGVHVYGTLCDHTALETLCDAHGLKLIFDAAHAFGSVAGNTPVAAMGDLTMFSLHATKLFNTFEGGLLTSGNAEDAQSLRLVRNFGIENEDCVSTVGINGKMSELHAAIGLLNLEKYEEERSARSGLRIAYDRIIDRFPGLTKQIRQSHVRHSEQYYMIRVDPIAFGATRDDVYTNLKDRQIFARKYFSPICTDFDCYRGETIHSIHDRPMAERVKDMVLCLPFHSGVTAHHLQVIESTFESLARRVSRGSACAG